MSKKSILEKLYEMKDDEKFYKTYYEARHDSLNLKNFLSLPKYSELVKP